MPTITTTRKLLKQLLVHIPMRQNRFVAHYVRFYGMRKMIHSSALSGFVQSGASTYDKGRHDYSKESLSAVGDIIINSLNGNDTNKNGLSIVELGAGTGKFTIPFESYCRSSSSKALQNAAFMATEPSNFLEVLKAKASSSDLLSVKYGTGESIPSADSSCDAIIAAQAFHWMSTEKTLLEIHRVLKSKRPLILIWNTYDYEKALWLKQLDDDILEPAYNATGTPRQQNYKWRDCFEIGSAKNPLFSKLQYWHHQSIHTGNFNDIVHDRIMSTSVIAMKSPSEKQRVREHISQVLNSHPQLAEERASGFISIPYITEIAYTLSV